MGISQEKYLKGHNSEIAVSGLATVMLVSGGYPEAYEKGKVISGLDLKTGSILFHAGTKKSANDIITNGGRVLAITSLAESKDSALEQSKSIVDVLVVDIPLVSEIAIIVEPFSLIFTPVLPSKVNEPALVVKLEVAPASKLIPPVVASNVTVTAFRLIAVDGVEPVPLEVPIAIVLSPSVPILIF